MDRPSSTASSTASAKDAEIARLQQEIAQLRGASRGSLTSSAGRGGYEYFRPNTSGGGGLGPEVPQPRPTVRNGYGIITSELAASEIGAKQHYSAEQQARFSANRRAYEQSALDAVRRGKTKRYANSVECSGTVLKATTLVPNDKLFSNRYTRTQQRLQRFAEQARVATPGELKQFDFDPPPMYEDFRRNIAPTLPGAPSTAACRAVSEEAHWNERKMRWNRAKFYKSEVKETIEGAFPKPAKPLLLPVGASHQQVLGIDNKLVGENPMQEAPTLRRPKVHWHGDQIGWSGKTGLPHAESTRRTQESIAAVNREPKKFDSTAPAVDKFHFSDVEGRRSLGFDVKGKPLY